jgi:hypothetical protein
MTLASKIFLAVLLVPCLGFAVWFIHHEMRTPQNECEVMDREVDLLRAGRYDKAGQVIQNWMNNPRRDLSGDGTLYHQLAMVYIAKAWHAPVGKDESVHLAALNLDKELDLYNRENPTSLRVDYLKSEPRTNSWEICPRKTNAIITDWLKRNSVGNCY